MGFYKRSNGWTNKVVFGVVSVLLLLQLLATSSKANDVQISPTGPTFGLINLQWGVTGANGFNNNFFFSPLFLTESVCVYIYNNNTTNNHSFSIGVSVNGNPQNQTPSDGSWLSLGQTNSVATGIATGVPGGMGVTVSGAPLVAVNLTNSVVLAGSPDTANVYIVQTTGTCFSGVQNPNIINGNGPGTNVQGMVAAGNNVFNVNPLFIGAAKVAVNFGVNTQGIDNSSNPFPVTVPASSTGPFVIGTPPQPSSQGEFAFAFYSPINTVGASSLAGPWSCVEATSCAVSSGTTIEAAFLNNYNTSQGLTINFVNGGGQPNIAFVAYTKAPTIAQHLNQNSNTFTFTASTNDYPLVAFSCNAACIASSVTDTCNFNYRLVAFSPLTGGTNSNTVYVFASLNKTGGGACTVTINMASGVVSNSEGILLANTTPAVLNYQSTPLFTSNNIFATSENDNGGLFTEAGGFSVTQTSTLAAAGTTTFSLWQDNFFTTLFPSTSPGPHGILYSCWVGLRVTAASGTTPTLDTFFQDSVDGVGWNDRMHFPQATAAANYIGAVSGGVGGITPVATGDGTLAAATKVDGPVGPFGRIKFVVGGTTPSFTFNWNVLCR